MFADAFRHRSGRVIALSRLIVSALFLVALWLEIGEPLEDPRPVFGLLGLYVVWSLVVLLITWASWWRDYRLAIIAHAIDVGAFGVIAFYTEGYISASYAFFIFLMLSAAMRWGWRETFATALVVCAIFLAAGASAVLVDNEIEDLPLLAIRSTYLIILSILLIWFGANQPRAPRLWRLAEQVPEISATAAPVQQILEVARRQLHAGRVLLAWWQREEPWLHVSELGPDGVETRRLDPNSFPPPIVAKANGEPFLFNTAHDRGLLRSEKGEGGPQAFFHTVNPAFARQFDLSEGMVVRVRARDYQGELFAMVIPGLCADDLWDAAMLGDTLSRLFDRSSMLAVSEEAAVARAKASLARDLHDSVVQVLAGTSFRLEALRSWIKSGRDPDPEIDALKSALSAEQRKVRDFIAELRSGHEGSPPVDLRAGMRKLVEELKHRWDIDCELAMSAVLPATCSIQHEVQQIIREAAANAKRHGGATLLRLEMSASDDDLSIRIRDDGKGFPAAGDQEATRTEMQPWSVHERVKRLGGTLQLRSGTAGTELSIQLPIGTAS